MHWRGLIGLMRLPSHRTETRRAPSGSASVQERYPLAMSAGRGTLALVLIAALFLPAVTCALPCCDSLPAGSSLAAHHHANMPQHAVAGQQHQALTGHQHHAQESTRPAASASIQHAPSPGLPPCPATIQCATLRSATAQATAPQVILARPAISRSPGFSLKISGRDSESLLRAWKTPYIPAESPAPLRV